MSKTLLLVYLIEFLAFIASLYYYRRDKGKNSFFLTCFLGLTIVFELLGAYTVFIETYDSLTNLKGTVWENNYWLYNIQLIISALFYTTYFKWQLTSKVMVKILNVLLLLFLLGSVSYLLFSEIYFVSFSPFTLIVGTLMILASISMYYLELLQSDLILNVTRSLPFYVSIGALIFHLCTPPLFLYGIYFSESINPEFVSTYKLIIFGSNFIMYTIYILGFIICAQSRKS